MPRRLDVVRNESPRILVLGEVGAENTGVGLAVDQPLIERLLALVDAHDVGRIGVLRQMRIVGGDPRDATEVDAVFMLENAACPGAGRLGVGAHRNPPALEVFRRHRLPRPYRRWCCAGSGRRRWRVTRQRFTVGLGLQVRDDRELAGIERALAHHRLEAVARDWRPAEIKADDRRCDPPVLQGRRQRAVGEVGLERDGTAGWIRSWHGALICC